MMYLAHTESLMAAVVDDEVFKQLSDLKLGLQVNCFSLLFHKLMAAVISEGGTTGGFFFSFVRFHKFLHSFTLYFVDYKNLYF